MKLKEAYKLAAADDSVLSEAKSYKLNKETIGLLWDRPDIINQLGGGGSGGKPVLPPDKFPIEFGGPAVDFDPKDESMPKYPLGSPGSEVTATIKPGLYPPRDIAQIWSKDIDKAYSEDPPHATPEDIQKAFHALYVDENTALTGVKRHPSGPPGYILEFFLDEDGGWSVDGLDTYDRSWLAQEISNPDWPGGRS